MLKVSYFIFLKEKNIWQHPGWESLAHTSDGLISFEKLLQGTYKSPQRAGFDPLPTPGSDPLHWIPDSGLVYLRHCWLECGFSIRRSLERIWQISGLTGSRRDPDSKVQPLWMVRLAWSVQSLFHPGWQKFKKIWSNLDH